VKLMSIFGLGASLLAPFLLLGCAIGGASLAIPYGFSDVPARGGIQLTYRNATRRTVCLPPDQWPNSAGKINQTRTVHLFIDGRRYPVAFFNTGYCLGGCPTYVKPGQTVTAFIPYRDFNLPSDLAAKAKRLEFSPVGYTCNAP
jgi:hypothetical protein